MDLKANTKYVVDFVKYNTTKRKEINRLSTTFMVYGSWSLLSNKLGHYYCKYPKPEDYKMDTWTKEMKIRKLH